MNKKKSYLGIYLIVSFIIIIAAVIVSLTAGINLGTDIGGGTQFEIAIEGNKATNEQIKKVKNVLKNNGTRAESVFVEDKHVDTLIVVRIADRDVENQELIKNDLVAELGVEKQDISTFQTIGSTITKKVVLWVSIAVVCLLLLLFIAGWIRYNIVSGLSLLFATLHSLMLCVSLLVLTRLPITKVSVIVILCALVLLLFAYVLFLERVRENAMMKNNESLSTDELVNVSQKSILKPLIILAALIFIATIVFMCVPIRFVTLTACTMLVCLVSTIYSYYFMGINMHERLLDLKIHADKLRLSKNESPEQKKVKKDKNK